MEFKHYNTNGGSMRTTRGTILKNKPYFVTFQESVLVSQWIFQLTYIYIYKYIYMRMYKDEKVQCLQKLILFDGIFASVKHFSF